MDSCSNSNLPRKLALSPITDMSDAELEHAATAPFRWIALSASEHRHNSAGLLLSRTKRTIENPIESIKNVLQIPKDWWATNFTGLYLVPGGRYLVTSCWDCCLAVWDLGYVSDGDMSTDGKPPKMWVTKANYIENFVVHPTPDGLGIRILTHSYVKTLYITSFII